MTETQKKAPGKHYRKGMTLMELCAKFPDDATAEAWFASVRWPDGARCPHCDHDSVQHPTTHPTMPYRCRGCRTFFSVRTGTGHGRLEARLSQVGHLRAPVQHQHQRHVLDETAPRPGHLAEVGVASSAPHPRDVGRSAIRAVRGAGRGRRDPHRRKGQEHARRGASRAHLGSGRGGQGRRGRRARPQHWQGGR